MSVWRILLLLILSWQTSIGYAASDISLLVPPENSDTTLTKNLKLAFNKHSIVSSLQEQPNNNIIVGIGQSFEIKNTQEQFMHAISVLPYKESTPLAPNKTHVLFQISPEAVIQYIGDNLPNVKIGIIYKDETDPFFTYAQNRSVDNVQLILRPVGDDIFSAVRRLRQTDEINVFLVTNDTRIYTGKNLRFLLEDMYRNNTPVISLSKQLVKAGAAFSITPNMTAFATKVVVTAEDILNNKPVPNVVYADKFNISINERLVKRYRLKLDVGAVNEQ